MGRYRVSIIERPEGWEPASPDDTPPELGAPQEVLTEADELFGAVRHAIDHNQSPDRAGDRRWAVVAEPGSVGRKWGAGRLCTPLTYKVAAIWWPTGWEPGSPLDVPNCVWRAPSGGSQQPMSYQRALATVRGLNRQSMDQAGTMWYVVIAVEHEPLSQTVSYDPSGVETTIEVRRLHVARPEPGGKGDCSHCPAHGLDCAKEDWSSLEQTSTEIRTG